MGLWHDPPRLARIRAETTATAVKVVEGARRSLRKVETRSSRSGGQKSRWCEDGGTSTRKRRKKQAQTRRSNGTAALWCGSLQLHRPLLSVDTTSRIRDRPSVSRLKQVPVVHEAKLQPPSRWWLWWRRGRVREWESKGRDKVNNGMRCSAEWCGAARYDAVRFEAMRRCDSDDMP